MEELDSARYRQRRRNRGKWCKGKPGTEHDFEWVFLTANDGKFIDGKPGAFFHKRCKVCGKQSHWHFFEEGSYPEYRELHEHEFFWHR